jgi:DNA-binding LytR/AlgR family response regulator
MWKLAICDDEATIRSQLSTLLLKAGKELGEEFEIQTFSSGESLLTAFPREMDLLLLDIEMGNPDGIETAHRIREFAPELCIIFITGYTQYALKSYSVRAFGFLPKPVSYTTLRNEISLALEQLKRKAAHTIMIKDRTDGVTHQVDVRNIQYFEVRDHDILAITGRETFYHRGTLNSLETELAPYGFFRCHAAFLVNQRFIASIGQDLVLSDGTHIPISRAKRKEFLTRLSDYIGDTL